MKQPKHTPGPWTVNGTNIVIPNLGYTCTIGRAQRETAYGYKLPKGEPEANAALMAAAPELYQSCQKFIDMLTLNPYMPIGEIHILIRMMRDSIAKAKGETHE